MTEDKSCCGCIFYKSGECQKHNKPVVIDGLCKDWGDKDAWRK